jgi:hypothetical protein
MRWHVHSRRKGHQQKKKKRKAGRLFFGLLFCPFFVFVLKAPSAFGWSLWSRTLGPEPAARSKGGDMSGLLAFWHGALKK